MKALKILPTLVFVFTANINEAQYYSNNTSDERNIMQIGITGGINNSFLYDTKGQDFIDNPIMGPVFGGFLSIPICTFLGIQPEVLYSAKGFSGEGMLGGEQSAGTTGTTPIKGSTSIVVTGAGSGDPNGYSFIDRMNYIDIPIMLQLKPLPTLYLLGGPEYSYLLSRYYTFTDGTTTQTTEQQFENDNIRRNIFGFIYGIDLNLSGNWSLSGRMAWDEEYNNGNGTSTLPRYRNYWEQVALGYRF